MVLNSDVLNYEYGRFYLVAEITAVVDRHFVIAPMGRAGKGRLSRR